MAEAFKISRNFANINNKSEFEKVSFVTKSFWRLPYSSRSARICERNFDARSEILAGIQPLQGVWLVLVSLGALGSSRDSE
jgi:hypothetical protein